MSQASSLTPGSIPRYLAIEHHSKPGQNVQVVADLDGRIAHVGDPVPGARHNAAFWLSGIAERWHDHYQPVGMGITETKATSAAESSPRPQATRWRTD